MTTYSDAVNMIDLKLAAIHLLNDIWRHLSRILERMEKNGSVMDSSGKEWEKNGKEWNNGETSYLSDSPLG